MHLDTATAQQHQKQLSLSCLRAGNTRILGVAPILLANIAIKPTKLEGFVERQTGQVQLQFCCQFNLSIAGLYHAPPLEVSTQLTTESIKGKYTSASGKRMDADGQCELVGTTEVPTTSDSFLNRFLTLPTEAFACMRAVIKLQTAEASLAAA